MGKIHQSFTLSKVKKDGQQIENKAPQGLFIWIGSYNAVDWIVGYHMQRGWIVDNAYNTGNHWLYDFFCSPFQKNGFIRLTRFI